MPWEEIFHKLPSNNGERFSWINGLKLQLSNTSLIKSISHFYPETLQGDAVLLLVTDTFWSEVCWPECSLPWSLPCHFLGIRFKTKQNKTKTHKQIEKEQKAPKFFCLRRKKQRHRNMVAMSKSFYAAHYSKSLCFFTLWLKNLRWNKSNEFKKWIKFKNCKLKHRLIF